jgi:hypothetical protein
MRKARDALIAAHRSELKACAGKKSAVTPTKVDKPIPKKTRKIKTRYIDHYGYVHLRRNGRDIKEQRYVMEQYLGRKLETDEVVHHIDGDRTNNLLDNLRLMPLGEHSKLHNTDKVRPNKNATVIRELRNAGLSQQAIAELVGCSAPTVSRVLSRPTVCTEIGVDLLVGFDRETFRKIGRVRGEKTPSAWVADVITTMLKDS